MDSNLKGKVGEREAAEFLREHGFPDAKRGQQYHGGTDSPDIVGGPNGYHIEVKRAEQVRFYEWWNQALRDCGNKEPIVMTRKNNGEWLAVLRADELMRLIQHDRNDPL